MKHWIFFYLRYFRCNTLYNQPNICLTLISVPVNKWFFYSPQSRFSSKPMNYNIDIMMFKYLLLLMTIFIIAAEWHDSVWTANFSGGCFTKWISQPCIVAWEFQRTSSHYCEGYCHSTSPSKFNTLHNFVHLRLFGSMPSILSLYKAAQKVVCEVCPHYEHKCDAWGIDRIDIKPWDPH